MSGNGPAFEQIEKTQDKALDTEQMLEAAREQNELFMEEHLKSLREDELNSQLASMGVSEEDSMVPPDIDKKDLEEFAKESSGIIESQELTPDEKTAVKDYMKNLKEKIVQANAQELKMLLADKSYQAREAIDTIYKQMYGESLEQALAKNGVESAKLYLDMNEKREKVFGAQQKVIDACYGIAA